MERKPADFTDHRMRVQTYLANQQIQSVVSKAQAFTEDPDAANRLSKQLCRCCYYSGPRVAGSAITRQPCASCGEVQTFPSTNTDALCQPCATEHQLCKHCGGDLHLRAERNALQEEPKEEL